MNLYLLLEKLHGHIALFGIALCFHPPLALRKARAPSRGVRWSAYLATIFLTVGTVAGWIVYPEYRREVRQTLYLTSRFVGKAFEVKEHIGTFALFLVLAGAVVTWVSSRPGMGPRMTPILRRVYGTAGALAAISAIIGIILSSMYGFAYGAGS